MTVCNTHCSTCGTSLCRLVDAPVVSPAKSDLHWMLLELSMNKAEALLSFVVIAAVFVAVAGLWL